MAPQTFRMFCPHVISIGSVSRSSAGVCVVEPRLPTHAMWWTHTVFVNEDIHIHTAEHLHTQTHRWCDDHVFDSLSSPLCFFRLTLDLFVYLCFILSVNANLMMLMLLVTLWKLTRISCCFSCRSHDDVIGKISLSKDVIAAQHKGKRVI